MRLRQGPSQPSRRLLLRARPLRPQQLRSRLRLRPQEKPPPPPLPKSRIRVPIPDVMRTHASFRLHFSPDDDELEEDDLEDDDEEIEEDEEDDGDEEVWQVRLTCEGGNPYTGRVFGVFRRRAPRPRLLPWPHTLRS